MGIPFAKQKKNDAFTEDTKNGAAAANEATDFNHGKANDLSGNLNNTANTSQGPGPTQDISHQIEPNNGNEAVLTSMHQVPTADAQNREQSLNKAVNKPQDVNPVKINPYIFTAERHAGRAMKTPSGANNDVAVSFKHKPPAPVKQKTKPVQHHKRTTAPVQNHKRTTAPVQEQTKPVQEQTKPLQEQTKPVQEQTKPVQEQTKPVQQQTNPVQQQTKPVQEQTKPVQQQQKTTAPVQQQTKPMQQQTRPVQEQTKPVQEQTKPVQQHTKPLHQQTKPVQEQTKPVQQQTKPAQQQTKPVQQQQKTTAPVQQQTKPVQQQQKTTALVQQQKKAPSPILHVTVSQQRPPAKETTATPQTVQTVPPCDMATADSAHTSQVATQGLCRYVSHQLEHSFELPASQMQASVHRLYSDVVRGVPTENLPTGTKAQINLLRQKYSRALPRSNEVSTDLTCQATGKTHNTAEQTTATSPGTAEELSDHSAEESELQVDLNALHQVIEHCLILTKRRREPAEITEATAQEGSKQQYCSATEAVTIEADDEPQQMSKPNKADDETNGNASSRLLKVNVEAPEPQVPAVEKKPTTAPNNAANNPTAAAVDTTVKSGLDPVSLPQDTDVKLETKCYDHALNKKQPDEKTRNVTLKEEMNVKDGQVVKEEQEPAVHAEGRRHPFKVNQSCPHEVQCKRNAGKGLPPNVQKWCDEPPYHLCEPPWVTTARLAAFLALTKAQEEGGDPPQ